MGSPEANLTGLVIQLDSNEIEFGIEFRKNRSKGSDCVILKKLFNRLFKREKFHFNLFKIRKI